MEITTATAWLVILTSSWNGEATRGVQMASLAECRTSLAEMKILNPTGVTIAAFCSSTKPAWWR